MNTVSELVVEVGHQHFGSGGYSAGYRVISGEVVATPIAGSDFRTSFIAGHQERLTAKDGKPATVRLFNSDGLSSSGSRSLGPQGLYCLSGTPAQVKVCPHCGHILDLPKGNGD